MRKLQLQDTFKMARIIKVAGLKDSISKAFSEGKKASNLSSNDSEAEKERIGMDIVFAVLDACAEIKVEEMVYDFVAGVFEMDITRVKEMSLDALVENVKQVFKENNMENFFKSAGRLS